jgi:hypothetical protein
MRSFEERRNAFEAAMKRDEELLFRVTARRNKLFGLWAAARLGLSAGAADAYAASGVAADFDAPGDGDVLGKVETDLAAQRIAVAENELRAAFSAAAVEARRQIANH